MTVWTLTSLVALVITLAFQSANGWRDAVELTSFVLATNYFGLNLFSQIAEENNQKTEKDNVFFSPFSVATALAMVHQGSNANTTQQLDSILGLKLAKIDNKSETGSIIQVSNQFLLTESSSQANVLKLANALIVDQKLAVKDVYKADIQKYFEAELISADFDKNSQEVMDLVNQWCSNKTSGKIPQLLSEPPSSSTQMALINAIYFKGSWRDKFEPNQTKPAPFYGADNKTYDNVQYMRDSSNKYYNIAKLKELSATLLELPYQNETMSFYAILPDEQHCDLSLIRKALNPWYIESAVSRLYEQEAVVIFPKFDLKSQYDLINYLKSLGLVDVFGSEANLSGISETPLAVSEVKHLASIEVNEEGSEAAAATYIGIVKMSYNPVPPPEYYFNHPFIFFLRHRQTGQILFIGEINKLIGNN